MKKNIILVLVTSLALVSCNFLDIVPDEKPTEEDAFMDKIAADRYMYSCYSYLPNPRSGNASLDLMTGDEVVTAFEHETFANFPKGNYTPSTPIISYWNTLFQGLRQCYIMLNNIETVPELEPKKIDDYIAQTNFLIAYYHFLLIRSYGPIILIKEEPLIETAPENYLSRSNYDDCVQFIIDKFDEAAEELPAKRSGTEYGLATSVAAKALKARLLLYAASPQFNGNPIYNNLKNKDGSPLFNSTYDPTKWAKAKEAYKEAIDLAHSAGFELYQTEDYGDNYQPADPFIHRLRYNIIHPANNEIIWADCNEEGYYGIQNKSVPFAPSAGWNGIAPTLTMIERFYTENGLPISEDPDYNYTKRFDVVTGTSSDTLAVPIGSQTLLLNLKREPRYYAWIAFHGGYFEIMSANSNGAYDSDPHFSKSNVNGKESSRLITNMLKSGNCGRQGRTNNYSPTGFLNKKGIDPSYKVSKSLSKPNDYPWPIVRLAELYLGYAEACVEDSDLPSAITYLNLVRDRAGIPDVETAWNGVATLNQDKLREIVRQERQIELYLENHNFWDMRRWLKAGDFFNVKAKGLNIEADNIYSFSEVQEVPFVRNFNNPAHYLMPIPITDINRNTNLVQNTDY